MAYFYMSLLMFAEMLFNKNTTFRLKVLKEYTARKLLKEMPSNIWNEQGLGRLLENFKTPVQLIGIQGT